MDNVARAQLRMSCLEMASRNGAIGADLLVEEARKLYAFVMETDRPKKPAAKS